MKALRAITIKKRLLLQLLLVVALFFCSIAFSFFMYTSINGLKDKVFSYREINDRTKIGKDLQLNVSLVWQYVTDASLVKSRRVMDEEARTSLELAIKDIDDLILLSGDDPEQLERLNILKSDLDDMWKAGYAMFEAFMTDWSKGRALMEPYDSISGKTIQDAAVVVASYEGRGERALVVISNQITRAFTVTAVSMVLLTLVLVVIVLSLINLRKTILRPLLDMEKAAGEIASGDLTVSVAVNGRDEMASLGEALNRTVVTLKDMILKIRNIAGSVTQVTDNIAVSSQDVLSSAAVQKQAVDNTALAIEEMDGSISRVAESSENLSESAVNTASAVSEMAASIESIDENANIFNDAAHETASSIEEMVCTIKEIAASLGTLAESSEAIAVSIDEVNATTAGIERSANDSVKLAEAVMTGAAEKGINTATAAMNGMENIKSRVSSLSEIIHMLGKRADDIGKIVNVIDDVADQTNLLAINASILASKAGVYGKGFAVVADEMKSLAERTSFSTSEIAELIQSVQDDTKASIKMAAEGIHAVDKGLILVRDVSGALQEIAVSSRESTDMAKAIQRATAEEALVIKQITGAVGNMTVQTENIARAIKEQGKGSSRIMESTEKIKDLARQVKISTGEQRSGSMQISEVITNVTEQAAQIADATATQKAKSLDIVRSVQKIHKVTDNLTTSAHNMNSIITSLKEDAESLLAELDKFTV